MKIGIKTRLEDPQVSASELFENVVDEARLAEKLGFDSFWIPEVHGYRESLAAAPLIVLSALSARTERIRLGVGVMLLPMKNPVALAEEVATVDQLSRGRLIVGLGIGSPTEKLARMFNVDTKGLGDRADEYLELMNALWTSDNVTFNGHTYVCKDLSIWPKPLQKPHPPIWIGTGPGNKRGLRRAARWGDAWLPTSVYEFKSLKSDWQQYSNYLKEYGREAHLRPIQRDVFLAEDRSLAVSRMEPILRKLYREVYSKIGFTFRDSEGKVLDVSSVEFERLKADRFIIGTPEDCVKEIARLSSIVDVNYLILRTGWMGLKHQEVLNSIELLGKKVLPQVAEL
jgi:probable F420-dependent oxidoreductase